MKTLNKKGQVMQNIGALGVGIATLVIILAVVFLMMAQTKTASIPLITATSYTNVTKTLTNNTYITFTECISDEAMSVTTVYNTSGATAAVISTGNYTVVLNTINTSVSGISAIDSKNITYSCRNPSQAYNSTQDLTNATATIPGWVPLIILVIIGGIILGLVSAFKRK